MNQPWRIEEGLKLIRAIQGRVKEFGYHIALGGGVLNNGTSDKDLDLYFLPFNDPNVAIENTEGLLNWLEKLWGEPRPIGEYPDPEDGPSRRRQVRPAGVRIGGGGGGDWAARILRAEPGAAVEAPAGRVVVRRVVDENEPAPAQNWAESFPVPTLTRVESSYKHKLKFERAGNDRIDVFVI